MTVYSHSRISSFENCPLKYRFRYIDRIKTDVQGIEAFMGKLVHEVLERLYADLSYARTAGSAAYRALFADLWRREYHGDIRIVRENMTAEDYRGIGERCLDNFYRRYHPFESGEVLGCEEKVEFSLDPAGRYRILGYIDRVDRTGQGVIEIHDYKTGGLPRASDVKRDRQLTLYEIALRQRWPGISEVRHIWHYLAHDREYVQQRSADNLRATRSATIRAIQRIESTVDFAARRTALCSWCDYKEICPEWAPVTAYSEPAPPRAVPQLDPGTRQYLLF